MDSFPREALLEIDEACAELEQELLGFIDVAASIRSLHWAKRYEEKPEDITGPYFMAEERHEEIVRKL